MLTIFLVIFSVIGLFLNWPILDEGIFRLVTTPLYIDRIAFIFKQYGVGIVRIDGLLVVLTFFIILLTSFFHTTKTVINLRIFLLALNSAVLSAELFSVLKLEYPFYTYPGLLYSLIFLLLAFMAAVFRIGSLKSFHSTFIGKPMSESQVFSQSIDKLVGNITVSRGIKIKAADNIQPEFKKGDVKEYETDNVRIGRERQWANLPIGDDWEAVSAKHGILRVIGETIFYEPLTGHYSFAVNGTPYKKSQEIKNSAELTLVSGYGPKLHIESYAKNHSLFNPRSMVRAGEIARDEFKKLQTTFKVLLVLAFLALPLLWFLLDVQKSGWESYANSVKQKNKTLNMELQNQASRMQVSTEETAKNQARIKNLKKKIAQLKKEGKTKEDQLKNAVQEYRRMGGERSAPPTIEGLLAFARVVDIKFCTQRIGIIFPFITLFNNGQVSTGSAFFAKGTNGEPYILAELGKVYNNKSAAASYFFLYTAGWENFSHFYQKIKTGRYSQEQVKKELTTFAGVNNLLEIPGKRWITLNIANKNKIAAVKIEGFPEYLRDDVPAVDRRVFMSDKVIFLGFKDGKKLYSCGSVLNIGPVYLQTDNRMAEKNDGGLLLKVLTEGRYSVIGILESAASGTQANRAFLKF